MSNIPQNSTVYGIEMCKTRIMFCFSLPSPLLPSPPPLLPPSPPPLPSSLSFHIRNYSLEGLPFFLGIAIYCYEGAGLILSLEGSVSKGLRDQFKTIFMVAMVIVTGLYIVFGVCGYLSFGPHTKSIITLNLPLGEANVCLSAIYVIHTSVIHTLN